MGTPRYDKGFVRRYLLDEIPDESSRAEFERACLLDHDLLLLVEEVWYDLVFNYAEGHLTREERARLEYLDQRLGQHTVEGMANLFAHLEGTITLPFLMGPVRPPLDPERTAVMLLVTAWLH